MAETEIPDHLPEWIRDHLSRYLDSNGEDGHMWDSTPLGGPGLLPTLILTTTGRKTGKTRMLPLIYGEIDGHHVVVASKGGAPNHPLWYENLVQMPEVGVQVASDRYSARARTATEDEYEEIWSHMVSVYAPYADYAKRATNRKIPLVILERSTP